MTHALLRLSVLTAVLVGLFSVQHASAYPITVDYTGVITSVGDFQASHFFAVGDAFSGSFTFDSDQPADGAPAGSTRQLNALSWATSYYSVALTTAPFPGGNAAFITDPSAPDRGVTGAGGFVTGDPVEWNGPVFPQLPTTLSINAPFGLPMMLFFENEIGLVFEIDGALTSFAVRDTTAVPEPATLLLLGTGLLGTAVGSFRRGRCD